MASDLRNRIAEKIIALVTDDMSIRDFRDWLAPIVWDIEDLNDSAAESLAYSVEVILAERDHGHISNAQMKLAMKKLVPLYNSSKTENEDTRVTDSKSISGITMRFACS